MERCFHCAEPLPPEPYRVTIRGREELVCCPGCSVVAGLIAETGLGEFYRFRTKASERPSEGMLDTAKWQAFDRPQLAERLTRTSSEGRRELRCGIEGITCSACVWLVEEGLRRVEGVVAASVNPVSRRVSVEFDPRTLAPSGVLAAIAALGFTPRPRAGSDRGAARAGEARAELKRLAVAGLGFVQVMMFSAALYIGAFKAMEGTFVSFFELVSLLVAVPVTVYAGAPIFRSAWQGLRYRRLGMDVPVALAILGALGASLINVFRGQGHVYFDSVTMFVFFLTLGRFVEARARHQAGSEAEALWDLLPDSALRKQGESWERVGTVELVVGDAVLVPPGAAVPADGRLVSERGAFDESLTSGESAPRARARGERVLGASVNTGAQPVEIEITDIGASSYLERVAALLDRAVADRPSFVRIADRWAGTFVAAVLAFTAITGLVWWLVAPDRTFDVVLAMLVATCPCALSLATPTALAVALSALARRGMLLNSSRVLERVGRISHWLFDKTGTLTRGEPELALTDAAGSLTAEQCRRIATALEAGIDHPLARAFQRSGEAADIIATDVVYRPGGGVSGRIGGRGYRLGSATYARGVAPRCNDEPGTSEVYLCDDEGSLARFVIRDALRPSAAAAMTRLARSGVKRVLVSGDREAAVASIARRLACDGYRAEQSPEDKLDYLRSLQRQGAVVAAVGDGINDAPLLAAADVSVAMIEGSRLAQANADVVFTGRDLGLLADLPRAALRTQQIVTQNLVWAIGYNAVALSAAAAGVLTPWLAALGMSASSVLVVLNALRLRRVLERRPARGNPTPLARLEEQPQV